MPTTVPLSLGKFLTEVTKQAVSTLHPRQHTASRHVPTGIAYLRASVEVVCK